MPVNLNKTTNWPDLCTSSWPLSSCHSTSEKSNRPWVLISHLLRRRRIQNHTCVNWSNNWFNIILELLRNTIAKSRSPLWLGSSVSLRIAQKLRLATWSLTNVLMPKSTDWHGKSPSRRRIRARTANSEIGTQIPSFFSIRWSKHVILLTERKLSRRNDYKKMRKNKGKQNF